MNLKIRTILWTLMLLTSVAFAQGEGTRGGGHVIEVNGKMELVDLVTGATCDWLSGEEMRSQNQYVDTILSKIAKLDWYLALELKREIDYLSWCMTGKLYSISSVDDDSFVIQLSRGVQQAAFRYHESAYIDQNVFNKLSPVSRAYLILHEVLHSYLPMDLEMRKFKLMSLVSTIRKVDQGQVNSREALHLNMSRNEMKFPTTVKKLDPYRKSLEFIFAPKSEQMATLLSVLEPEKLIHPKLGTIINALASWDRSLVENPLKTLEEVILYVMNNREIDSARFVLSTQTYTKVNPASIALGVYYDLPLTIQTVIKESTYFSKIVEDGENFLNEISFKIENNRIVGDLNLQKLSEQCGSSVALHTTSLTIPSRDTKCQMPTPINALADLMLIMANSDENDVLKQQFLDRPEFLSALRMEKTLESLNSVAPVIQREKALAQDIVRDLQKAMVNTMKNYVQDRLDVQENEVLNKIFNNLKI